MGKAVEILFGTSLEKGKEKVNVTREYSRREGERERERVRKSDLNHHIELVRDIGHRR